MSTKPIVLVVDDLPLNRMMVILALRQLGCEAVEAGDGAEALEAFECAAFDLVVMDCQMPVMDGLTASGQIRARRHQTPIIGYTTGDNREECLAAGMNDYLAKPAPLGVLKAKLAHWLNRAEAA
jgi:CheY-like chemotaxis protein